MWSRVRRVRPSVWALAIYCALSFLYFGVRLLVEPGAQYIGPFDDPQIVIWAFGWFPHAVLHGHNPLDATGLWAPIGVNLTWTTVAPGLSLIFAPLALLIGPFAAYNLAAMLMPAVSAWTAFLLCREITRSFWPSLAGGYLFGFSAYMLGHEEGHIHMSSIFLVPLVALVLLRFVRNELDGRGLVVRLAPLLVLELLFSSELVFTLTLAVFGSVLLAFAVLPERRARLRELVAPLSIAYCVAGVISIPYLWFLWKGLHKGAYVPPEDYVVDLVNLFVPTRLELLGAGWAGSVTRHFTGNDTENGAFLGPAVILIIVLFLRAGPLAGGRRFLIAALGATVFFSLGGSLHVAGKRVVTLPWHLFTGLPLWNNVLTVRFAMFTSLVLAVVLAMWAAAQPEGTLRRVVLPVLAVAALLPNPWSHAWATTYTIPPFFTAAEYRSCLAPGEIILPVPVGVGGNAMLWHVAGDFRFRMAAGRIQQVPPTEFMHPMSIQMIAGSYDLKPGQAGLVRAYAKKWGVTTIIADPVLGRPWLATLDRVAKRQEVGGVYLYSMSRERPSCTVTAG